MLQEISNFKYLWAKIHPVGYFLIKVTGGLTLRFLPRAVQQSKLLSRVGTISRFLHHRADM